MDRSADQDIQEVIDLDGLKTRCLGNLNLVERVLTKFTVQLESDLLELERAMESGDAALTAHVAHRIKGSAGSVEARKLYEHAGLAEQRALKHELPGVLDCVEKMRCDRKELVETIAEMRQGV